MGLILSFLTQLVIASQLGTSFERDAYFVAMAVPTYISAVFLGAYGMVFLPIFIQNQSEGKISRKYFISNNFNIVFIFLSLVALVGIFFSEQIINLTAIGFKEKEVEFVSLLLKILFPTIVFQGLANILTSVSQSRNKFTLPAMAPVVTAMVSLLFVLVFTPFWGIKSLAIGTLAGHFLALVMLLPVILKDYQFYINLRDRKFHQIILLSLPIFISGFITRSNVIFERFVASTLPEGSISYLGYATQIQNILCSIAIGGIGTMIFPLLSRKWAEKDLEATRTYYEKGIRLVFIITIPLTVLFIFEGTPLFQIIFERGKFLHTSTIIVSKVFTLLSISFICNSLGSVVSKIFYLTGKTLLGSIIDVCISLLYFFVALLSVKFYSFYGLALAASFSSLMSIIASFILANRILQGLNFYYILKSLGVALAASLLAITITSYMILPLIQISNVYGFVAFICLLFGGLLYLLLSLAKLQEVAIFNAYFKARFLK
ncbi:MAG: murein biosynthesis integral membrane protein MurJ [Adhaeribacter sp.]